MKNIDIQNYRVAVMSGKALLGARGFKTSTIKSDRQLLFVLSNTFDIECNWTKPFEGEFKRVVGLARGLSKKQRARRYVGRIEKIAVW